jgi:hypothetical protein
LTQTELVVIVVGGFCVGKSTLVENLAAERGGLEQHEHGYGVTADGTMTVLGKGYGRGAKTPGTDRLDDVLEAARNCNTPILVAEGFKLSTFGLLPLTLLHQGRKQLAIALWCDNRALRRFSMQRRNKPPSKRFFERRASAMSAAKKYESIGVPVCRINVSNKTPEEVCEFATRAIEAVYGNNTNS